MVIGAATYGRHMVMIKERPDAMADEDVALAPGERFIWFSGGLVLGLHLVVFAALAVVVSLEVRHRPVRPIRPR